MNSVKFNPSSLNLDLKLKQNHVKVIQLIPNNVTTNKVIRDVIVENNLYINSGTWFLIAPEDSSIPLQTISYW